MATNRFTLTANIGPTGVTTTIYSATIGGNEQIPLTSIAAAKTGQLTTRTSASVGTLTMDSGHGFTTGQKDISIFWTEGGVLGSRRNVLVGTVATNSVPFSGGTGDNLPTNLTSVTAMAPTTNTSLTGDLSSAIDYAMFTNTSTTSLVIFSFGTTSGGNYTENAAVILNESPWSNAALYDSLFITNNELAAATAFDTVKMTHGDSSQAVAVQGTISYAV